MEILARLGQQRDRGSRIDKITDLDHMLPLADAGLCSGETDPTSLRIHLDFFQRLAQIVGVGRLFGTCHQAARGVQDRAISFDWNGAEGSVLLATPGHGEESRAGHEGQAHASGSLAAKNAPLYFRRWLLLVS